MKNKIFHTQDLCLRTNLRCAKDSARMEINLKKYIAAIGICFMALGAACIMKKDPEEVGEELPELIIGSDNYEPYNYLDDDGKPVGIDVELAEAVCEQLGYTPVFQYIVWDKKDEYLDNGKVDCLWGSFTMNGREDEYQWAGPYLYSRQVIAVRTDSKIRNISDLAGKRVAVQATTKPAWTRSMQASGKGMWMRSQDMKVRLRDLLEMHRICMPYWMKVCIFQNWELLSKMTLIRILQKK